VAPGGVLLREGGAVEAKHEPSPGRARPGAEEVEALATGRSAAASQADVLVPRGFGGDPVLSK
jgi:hypothetical protein